MKKRASFLFLLVVGMGMFMLLGSCDMPGGSSFKDMLDGSSNTRCPDCPVCPDVSRVADVIDPLNPEEENRVSRSINIIKYDGNLYAMYLNASTAIDSTQFFQVYVSVHGCGDEWTRTNQGQALNIKPKGIQGAIYCHMQLIEYQKRLFAFWQETSGKGMVMHVKRYDQYTDLWERVDDKGDLGLSGFYITNPNTIQHWAYFNCGGAAVYNNKLYVSWRQKFGDNWETAFLKYDEDGWLPMNPVVAPGRETWTHLWIALAAHNCHLYLASITKVNVDSNIGYLEVYEYDSCANQWSQISQQINISTTDYPTSPSLLSCNGTLYIAWREITNASSEHSAFPYKIYVKAYQGGTSWEFAGSNPVMSHQTYIPLLVEYKDKLTVVFGDVTNAYIRQLEGDTWVDFPQPGPFVTNIAKLVKFPNLEVFSAISANDKIYFAWRKKGNADDYFCGYVDDIAD